MKKVLLIPSNLKAEAIVYYRGTQPARFLVDSGGANVRILTSFKNNFGTIDLSPFAWADTIITQRFYYNNDFYKPLVEGYKLFKGTKIYETDDLVWDIPFKPIRKEYNKTRDFTDKLIQEADVITCTTEYLKQQILKRRQRCRVDVIPNSVDMYMWLFDRQPHDKIRILYSAGGTHWKEIKFIKKVLKQIKKKHNNIETILLSPYYLENKDKLWDKVYNFVPFKNYAEFMTFLSPDIGLAPIIQKTPFNLSKSEIKFIDLTMGGAVSVIENCETYSSVENALKANSIDEYIVAIEKLLDKNTREELLKKAKDEVYEKFNIQKNVGLWKKAINRN